MAKPPRSRTFSILAPVVASCGLGASGEGLAQDADGLRRCRAISEASARLACYDGLAIPQVNAPVPAARVPGTSAPRAVVPQGPGAPPEDATKPVSRFGLEHEGSPARADRITSHIQGTFHGWRPNSEISLANGQIWQVVDGSTMASVWESPRVSIRRGMFGSFYLDIEGENRSARVRRIK